ncbi:MAG: sigma-54-dependent Fis family transcriptional regulator [Gemmataceae bacterium]|nr:sigma-54-dependent Fis family transcriptional regulator [Gemmataceae bacterium]
MATILIIDDEPALRGVLSLLLRPHGHAVFEAASGPEGVAVYEARRPDLVLCDVVLPGFDGIAVLGRIKALNPAAPVIVMTGDSTAELAIRAMALGASDYLVKPLDLNQTLHAVRQSLDSSGHPMCGTAPPGPGPADGQSLLGKTDAMYEVFKLIGRVAPQRSTVLVLGESGTGKELVARSVHTHGPSRSEPFIALNCAAIPEALLESELFGHEKGAFTGADRQRPGKFEVAGGGTLFLDEVGDMSPTVQSKLLRVLQDQEFYRLGGVETVRTSARIIAATNRDLREDVAAGRFRADLFYRLGGVVIRLPPLRERRADIPVLADHFLRRSAAELRRPVRSFAPAALELLCAYRWPGNIRELANVIQQAVLQSPGQTVLPAQVANLLPDHPAAAPGDGPALFDPAAVRAHVLTRLAEGDTQLLAPMLAAYEREVIAVVLEHCHGNLSTAARHLGLHRVTLKSKLVRGSIPHPRATGPLDERVVPVTA